MRPHLSGIPLENGPLVKRLRHGPFTAVTWVRFPYGSPCRHPEGRRQFGGLAQLVRAPASHAGGHWFESSSLHQEKTLESQWFRGFFFAFFWKKRASLLAVFWGIFGQFRGFLLQKCCKFFRSSIRCATRVCGFLGRVVCCKLFRQLPCRMPAGPSPQFAAPDFYDHSKYKHSASCPSCCVQPNTGSPLRPIQLQKDV